MGVGSYGEDRLETLLREYESPSSRGLLLGADILADAAVAMARAWPAARVQPPGQVDPALLRLVLVVARLHRQRALHLVGTTGGGEELQAAKDLTALAQSWDADTLTPGSGVANTTPVTPRVAWDSHTSAVVYAAWHSSAGVLLDVVISVWQTMATAHGDTLAGNELGRHVAMLLNLGSALGRRFHRDGKLVDLDAAVAFLRDARSHTGTDSPLTPAVLSGLSETLRQRYGVTGNVADLDEAVELGRIVVDSVGADDPQRPLYLYELADGYLSRFARATRQVDVTSAIECLQESVDITSPSDPTLSSCRSRLIDALSTRFQYFHEPTDLGVAVDLASAAVDTSVGAVALARANSDLAGVLLDRLQDRGEDKDLQRAVAAARAAAKGAPSGDVNYPHYLSQLSLLLRILFERTRSRADLREAIYAARIAVRVTPLGSADLARRKSNLGFALSLLAERTSTAKDLANAVQAAAEAVDAIAPGHPDRPTALSNLAAAYQLRHRARRDRTGPADLDAAISATRDAIRSAPVSHPSRATFLSNLSTALLMRYHLRGSQRDYADALDAIERATRECVPGSPDSADYLYNLALVLDVGSEFDDADPDLADRAVAAYRSVVGLEVAPVRVRTLAARGWARNAAERGDWNVALSAYQQAVNHAQAWAWHGSERADTFAAMSDVAGIANDAAAAAIQLGRPVLALSLLEQGHGVAYSWAVGLNADRAALHAAHPDLAARLDRIRRALDTPTVPHPGAPSDSVVTLDHVQNLAREWHDLLADVRSRPGFAEFLRAPQLGDLTTSADEGPIVVVNISRHRCDAVLVTRTGITLVPLPRLTIAAAKRQTGLLTAAQRSMVVSTHHRAQAHRTARRVLRWAWDTIAEPVTAALGFDGEASDLPRMWWYPTGCARFLPLHAAGRHPEQPTTLRRRGTSAPTMLHRAISSYLPTLGALTRGRARSAPDLTSTALVVAVPNPPGASPLPGVLGEVARITPHLDRANILQGPAATRAALLHHLTDCHLLHFAGHGMQDPQRGGGGVLFTHDHQEDEPVSMRDIAGLNLQHADLAFLSACETAQGDAALADESVHVAGSLQMAGFTHTVGTQWVTGDLSGAKLAARFYRHLRVAHKEKGALEHADIATALHDATLRLYDGCADRPLMWAHYVHTGP